MSAITLEAALDHLRRWLVSLERAKMAETQHARAVRAVLEHFSPELSCAAGRGRAGSKAAAEA